MLRELVLILLQTQFINSQEELRWTNGIIPFVLHPSLSPEEVERFKSTTELFNSKLKGCLMIRLVVPKVCHLFVVPLGCADNS